MCFGENCRKIGMITLAPFGVGKLWKFAHEIDALEGKEGSHHTFQAACRRLDNVWRAAGICDTITAMFNNTPSHSQWPFVGFGDLGGEVNTFLLSTSKLVDLSSTSKLVDNQTCRQPNLLTSKLVDNQTCRQPNLSTTKLVDIQTCQHLTCRQAKCWHTYVTIG
jgi:hypothetical protein